MGLAQQRIKLEMEARFGMRTTFKVEAKLGYLLCLIEGILFLSFFSPAGIDY